MFERSRRFVALLLIGALMAAHLPLPTAATLVQSHGVKDRSEPFPCQDRPCGCRTAQQCRERCCCFSVSQREAWFARHATGGGTIGVEKGSPPSCCPPERPEDADEPAASTAIVLMVMAARCQGESGATPAAIPWSLPPDRLLFSLPPLRGSRMAIPRLSWLSLEADRPPLPPPRLV